VVSNLDLYMDLYMYKRIPTTMHEQFSHTEVYHSKTVPLVLRVH